MSALKFFRLFSVGLILALVAPISAFAAESQSAQTERQYLSGRGPKDAVPWGFSVTGGRRAGEQTTIPVPSNWEQHGFGAYSYGLAPIPRSDERGLYRLTFSAPETWKGRRIRIVFDGVMTDATVKVNGRSAGPTHHGAFYRFHYDITSLVKFGADPENLLEVDVAKASANAATDLAERGGDYWVFGGIFRPVWLEAAPAQAIEHTAIDARADGTFTADLTLSAGVHDATDVLAQIHAADGTPVGAAFQMRVPGGGTGRVRLATKLDTPRLWTAETPHLYSLQLALRKGSEVLHATSQRFGFRTFEVRAGQGLFLNGQRILLKGVNRHSFRPDTARTLNPEDCYEDVRLIRSMNMNAVRMSHYPPDTAFLDACDELGLYVLNELSGWHHAHETEVGRRLIREMVERDVNHPSILFWDNGNEGGWNRELDGEFALHDPQKRPLILPSDTHDDLDTKHYSPFDELSKKLRGPHLVMPTEFIHALYDGGAGAGLDDYWNAITQSPFGCGGFIWALMDEGIVRTDQGGRIDVYASYAPDGLVGPRHEKEGSFYTVRDLWSPVQITAPVLDEKFSGKLAVTNRYDFTSLANCRFAWRLVRYPEATDKVTTAKILAEGNAPAPAIAPHASGELVLSLPKNWRDADALVLTAFDPNQQEVWTWTWPTPALSQRVFNLSTTAQTSPAPKVEVVAGEIRLVAGDVTASFDQTTGLLRAIRRGGKISSLTDGPRLTFARPESAAAPEWLAFASEDAPTQTRRLTAPHLANTLEIDLDYVKADSWAGFKLEISPDGQSWKTLFDGVRRKVDLKLFNFPPQLIAAVRLSKVIRASGEPIAVNSLRLGYAAARFPAAPQTQAAATTAHGTERDPRTGETVAWLESRGANGLDRLRWTLCGDGSLRLDYAYTLSGDFLHHGLTFNHPEETMKSLRWLGAGPYRVWQNRLRGTWLGVHEIAYNNIQPGDSWSFPEFQGCFAGLRWARLETDSGGLHVKSASPDVYLRVGTPRISHQMTTVEFPAGDVSFLHAIPAMGSKFVAPEASGPGGLPAKASGSYSGSLVFSFE
jgi:hypothetical protein